jgi:hypothetical protein
MNLPIRSGPKKERDERRQSSQGTGEDGDKTSPAAICAEVVAESSPFCLGEDTVGVFDYHDGVVDDDAETKQEGKKHDKVERDRRRRS